MSDWIPTLGPLLGVALGGAITYLMATRQLSHQYKRDRQKDQMQRFETIHKSLTAVDNGAVVMSGQLTMYVIGGKTFDPTQLQGILQFNDLRMLVDFYAPSLSPDVDAIADELRKMGEASMDILTKDQPAEKKAAALKGASAASAIREKVTATKVKLSTLAREYYDKEI